MNKKQQKWTALLVTVTFIWLLQVSTMPLAAGAPERIGSASAEQGPGVYEAVTPRPAPAPKKSILPYVLIGVGVVAVAAVLILVVFKTSYDITGTWNFSFTGPYSTVATMKFTGTKTSGSFEYVGTPALAGAYTVDGKNFTVVMPNATNVEFTGTFTDKDTLTGTWVDTTHDDTWNFTATRAAATTAVETAAGAKPVPAAQANVTGPR
jgi:hypothetical protein